MNTLDRAIRLLAEKCLDHYNKNAKRWGGSIMLGEYSALCAALSYLCACPHDFLDRSIKTIPCVINDVNHVWVSRDYYNAQLDTCTMTICVISKNAGLRSRQHVYSIRVADNAFYAGIHTLMRAKRNPFLRALYNRLHDKMYLGE